MGAALYRETPVPVLQLLQAEAELQGPVSGSEDPDRHRGVSTLGQHVRRGCLPTGTARERPGRPPPPHAGAGDTSGQVGYTDPLAGEKAHGRRAVVVYVFYDIGVVFVSAPWCRRSQRPKAQDRSRICSENGGERTRVQPEAQTHA